MVMAKEKKRRMFELLPGVGPHFEPNIDFDKDQPEDDENLRDVEYVAGEQVESTRDLVNAFPGKFKEVTGGKDRKQLVGRPDPETGAQKNATSDDESEGDAKDEDTSGSVDVTEEFEGAEAGGMQVFKDADGHYFVHEAGEDQPMAGSKKGFTTKTKALALIKKNSGE
jgi:hypothetical protein